MSLIPRKCQECGERRRDVQLMPDPFSEALYPEDTDHDLMWLCAPCATARFEES
ncbi:hypothetical protein [Streptomyces sp. NPDC002067]